MHAESPGRPPQAGRRTRRPLGLLAALLALAGPWAAPLAAQRPGRIAFVDSRVLLDSLPGRGDAEAQLDADTRTLRDAVRLAADSLKASVDDFGRRERRLTPGQREALLLALRAREAAFEELVRQATELADQRRAALVEPLRERIRQAVRAVRVERGYAAILDLAAEQVIADVDPALDVTGLVLARLRREAAAAP